MPFFSVVIPTYNRSTLLRAAVESVLAQTLDDYEIIVVDDGSTDDTPQVLAEWGGRVKAIRQENAGPAIARNRGIAAARGEYCAFLDSDDLWFPWTLAVYREAIEKSNSPAGVIAMPFHFTEPGELDSVTVSSLKFDRYENYLDFAPRQIYRGSNVCAWKTSALCEVGGFVEEKFYGEDIELFLRLGIAPGLTHIAVPQTVAVRKHAGGSLGNLVWHSAGARMIIARERAGLFPGGAKYKRQRTFSIITHCMVICLWCIEQRQYSLGFGIYLRMIDWLIRCGRIKFLLGFPLAMLFPALNPLRRPEAREKSNVAASKNVAAGEAA